MDSIDKKPIEITKDEKSEDLLDFEMGDELLKSEEQKASELSKESSSEDKGHPFQPPPPDAGADTKDEDEDGAKTPIMLLILGPRSGLQSLSGSSVKEIVKYIIKAGFEVTDERRFSKTLLKQLKSAIAKAEKRHVKRSLKPSEALVKKPKSMEKMKEKAVKKKQVNKQKAKAKSVETEQVDEGVKAKKAKKRKSEPKTTKAIKKNKIADQAAVKEDDNEKAKITKNLALEPKTTQKSTKLMASEAGLRNLDDINSDIDSEQTLAVAAVEQNVISRRRKTN